MRGFTGHNTFILQKVNKQVHKKLEFLTGVGTIAHLKQAGVVHDTK